MTSARRRRLARIQAGHVRMIGSGVADRDATLPAGITGNHLDLEQLLILIEAGTWRAPAPLIEAYGGALGFKSAQAMWREPARAAELHKAALARVLLRHDVTELPATTYDLDLDVVESIIAKTPAGLMDVFEFAPGVHVRGLLASEFFY
jgi:hypothetical protein